MEAFFWTPPTAEWLAKGAYTAEDFPEPEVDVEEENWPALMLFARYSSQVRVGMGGVVGLDMNVFHHVLDRMGLDSETYEQYVTDLFAIEPVAVKAMNTPP